MTSHARRARSSYRWRRLAELVKAQESVCWICQQPVDKSLRFPHPRSATVDHVIEAAAAPHLMFDRSNLRLACFGCNASRGASFGNARRSPEPPPRRQSREW